MGLFSTFTSPLSPHVKVQQDKEVLMRVAEETGYNIDTLWKVYGYESSYGQDPMMDDPGSSYHGPFQFSRELATDLGIDRYDLYESGLGFVKNLTAARDSLEANIKNTSGDLSYIESLDPALVDYLLHQQGGLGVARIALAAYSGDSEFSGGSEWYMNKIAETLKANLSESQRKNFDNKKNPKEKIDYYIQSTKENLEKR